MTAAGKSRTAVPAERCAGSPKPLGFHTGDPSLVMSQYRRHILSCKKRWSSARGLVHYKGFVQSYLWAKRIVIASRGDVTVSREQIT